MAAAQIAIQRIVRRAIRSSQLTFAHAVGVAHPDFVWSTFYRSALAAALNRVPELGKTASGGWLLAWNA